MSNFLTNLARRGAGLAPETAPQLEPTPRPIAVSAVTLAHDSARVYSSHTESTDRVPFGNAAAPHIERTLAADSASPTDPLPVPPGLVSQSPRQDLSQQKTKECVRPDDSERNSPRGSTSALVQISLGGKKPSLHGSATAGEPSLCPSTAPDKRATSRPGTTLDGVLAPARRKNAEPLLLLPRPASVAVEPGAVSPIRALTQPSIKMASTMPQTPHIQVRIGKVEVRASQSPPPSARITPSKVSGEFAELALARAHLNRNHR